LNCFSNWSRCVNRQSDRSHVFQLRKKVLPTTRGLQSYRRMLRSSCYNKLPHITLPGLWQLRNKRDQHIPKHVGQFICGKVCLHLPTWQCVRPLSLSLLWLDRSAELYDHPVYCHGHLYGDDRQSSVWFQGAFEANECRQ